MDNYDLPLPRATTEKMFGEWLQILRRYECAMVISLPKFDRHYRVQQFLNYCRDDLKNVRTLKLHFNNLVAEETGEFKNRLQSLFNDIPRNFQCLVFVLDGEWLLSAAPHLIPTLQQFILEYDRCISFVTFFESNCLSIKYGKFFSQCPSLLENVIYQKLYSAQDIRHFLRHMSNIYGLKLTGSNQEEIIHECQGYIWLATEALRHLHKNGNLSFSHPAFLFRLEAIWQGLNKTEQETLKKIALKSQLSSIQNDCLQYFTNCGLVKHRSGDLYVTVPVLQKYIEDIQAKTEAEITLTGIKVNNVDVTSSFSAREIRLLSFLKQNENKIVSRNLAAKFFWKISGTDSYTDWGLDQAIKRLRQKLVKLEIPIILQTVKGQGYKLLT